MDTHFNSSSPYSWNHGSKRENTAAYVALDMWMKLSTIYIYSDPTAETLCIKEIISWARFRISFVLIIQERFSEYKTKKCCWVGLRRVPGMYTNQDRESLIKELDFVNRILRGREDPRGTKLLEAELERIARLKQAETDILQLKANEAKRRLISGSLVAEFKHLLRVKLIPKNEYLCLPFYWKDPRSVLYACSNGIEHRWHKVHGIWWCFSQEDHPTFGLFCDKPMSHGQCNMVVERLDDYLIESGI
ncbi:hypothetical protein Bca52824_025771 [Brassica carinata]|uniref:Uncharacterized protein n=1 Tax=Brassica carinata TaxID=52824 RepID=A0A8X7SF16_BRACI|nr:hypothetical protein Bca52824_025771 [Brassica carinata]